MDIMPRRARTVTAAGSSMSMPFQRHVLLMSSRTEHQQDDARLEVNGSRRLFARAVTRDFAMPPAAAVPLSAPVVERPSATVPSMAPPSHPPIDLGRLSEDVYQYIQRKARIERERRGL
jgi:hypothetical protein